MKILRNTVRILVGLVFVFSGFVKGVDPLGTVYRMNDYFQAFSLPWFQQFSLPLTIILCMLEFVLGASMLFNLWIRKTVWLMVPLMLYFTVLTFFDAFFNIVPDCGCFGDAIKLTNMQTFLKNLVLMALVTLIFIWRKKYRSLLPVSMDVAALFVIAAAFTAMSVLCYRHLPLIDFMGWKVGNRINKPLTKPVTFYVTYKNKKTGEEKEYVSPNYPWNDSVWMSQWVFKSQRADDPNKDAGMVLKIEDSTGTDYTAGVIDNPGYQFIAVAYDLEKTSREGFAKIVGFYKDAAAAGSSFVCLSSTVPAETVKFRTAMGVPFDIYLSDDVVLKTMVRSNPGLILLKNGVVIAKWGWRDIPDFSKVRMKYMK